MDWSVFQHLSRSRAVGEPVFLRCVITCAAADAARTLAETTAFAADLLGAPLRTLHARGHLEGGSLQVTLIFRTGATALLLVGPGEHGYDVMLLGNRGGAYLERVVGECEAHSTDTPEWPTTDDLLSLIHRSLAEGRSIPIAEDSHA